MTPRSRHLLLLGTVAALTTVGVVFGRSLFVTPKPEAVPQTPTVLFVPPERLNFGRTWESPRFAHSFPVTNRGTERLTVEGISSSCSCLSVSPPRFTLAPNESVTVTAEVDLTAKPREGEDAAFILTPTAKFESGAEHPKTQWVLTGKSRKLLTLDRRPTLGRVSVLDQPLKPVKVIVTTAIPLEGGIGAKSDHPNVVAKCVPHSTDANKFTLELSAATKLPLGPVKGTVTLTPADRTEKNLPVAVVPLDAVIVPDVECLPPAVLGGGHPVGATFTQSVTLASLGKRPFKVLSATAEGAGLSVKQVGDEFLISQKCEQPGQQTGKVVFQVEAADGRYAITADVTYVGVKE